MTCNFTYDMRILVNVHPTTQKPKNFDGFFLSKVYKVWATKNKGVILHDTEQWCKIWINLDTVFQKWQWHEEFGGLSLEHSNVLKIVLS